MAHTKHSIHRCSQTGVTINDERHSARPTTAVHAGHEYCAAHAGNSVADRAIIRALSTVVQLQRGLYLLAPLPRWRYG
jgi:hypothetical protein